MQTYVRELLRALPGVVRAELAAVVQADVAATLPAAVVALRRRPCDGARRTLVGLRPVGSADLVHGLDVDLPLRPRAPTVTTVHDLAVFDVPWAFGRVRAATKRLTTARSIRRADRVVAVSAFTAERVAARFGREAVVVHEAPPPDLAPPDEAAIADVRSRYPLPERFVLHVGNLEPRKDVPTLAAACRAADVPLVLTGGSIETVPVPSGARRLGWVPAADLAALYGAATVVGYVSRYEGFGLPPVEAMACGAAVLATRTGALGEVAPDGAEYVAVGDVEGQARALRALLADPERRRARAEAGLAAARRLSWRATAEATAAVYRSLGVR